MTISPLTSLRDGADGAVEGNPKCRAPACADKRRYFGQVVVFDAHDRRDDLYFVSESLVEQRAQRLSISLALSVAFSLALPSLLRSRRGFSRHIQFFFVIYAERKEVAFSRASFAKLRLS
jgi:hypothetical protein